MQAEDRQVIQEPFECLISNLPGYKRSLPMNQDQPQRVESMHMMIFNGANVVQPYAAHVSVTCNSHRAAQQQFTVDAALTFQRFTHFPFQEWKTSKPFFRLTKTYMYKIRRIQISRNQTLLNQRLAKILTTVYKVVNRQGVSESLCDLVELRESNYNLRGDKILTLPKVNTSKYGLKSLRYEGANLWNKLPNEYRKADSYKLFKKQISDTDLAGRYMS